MLTTRGIAYKLGVGTLAAFIGVAVYLVCMGQLSRFGVVMSEAGTAHALAHAPNVFLEGVAIAFVYERLRWAMGGWASIWVPCLLFAAAHIPRSVQAGRSPTEILFWFGFNTILPVMILLVLRRSRDVIWIFIPHYLLDVAIGAFG